MVSSSIAQPTSREPTSQPRVTSGMISPLLSRFTLPPALGGRGTALLLGQQVIEAGRQDVVDERGHLAHGRLAEARLQQRQAWPAPVVAATGDQAKERGRDGAEQIAAARRAGVTLGGRWGGTRAVSGRGGRRLGGTRTRRLIGGWRGVGAEPRLDGGP